MLIKQQQIGLMVSCLAIAASLIFVYTMNFALNKSKLDYIKWDLSNVTLRDFSVQLTITPEIWETWLDHKVKIRDNEHHECKGSFRNYIKSSMIKQLKEFGNAFNKPDGPPGDNTVDIATIVFAFDNAQVMKLLQKRK